MERGKYKPVLIIGVSEEDEPATSTAAAAAATASCSRDVETDVETEPEHEPEQHALRRSLSEIQRNRSRQFFRSLYLKRRQYRQTVSVDPDVPATPVESAPPAPAGVDIRFNITDSIDESEEINLDVPLPKPRRSRSTSYAGFEAPPGLSSPISDSLPTAERHAHSHFLRLETPANHECHLPIPVPVPVPVPIPVLQPRRQRDSRASSIMSNSSWVRIAAQSESPNGSTRTAAALSLTSHRKSSVSASASASASASSTYETCFKSAMYLERMGRRASKPSPAPAQALAQLQHLAAGPTKSMSNLAMLHAGTKRLSEDRTHTKHPNELDGGRKTMRGAASHSNNKLAPERARTQRASSPSPSPSASVSRFDEARNSVSFACARDKRATSPSSSSANRAEEQLGDANSLARLLVSRDFKTAIQKARSINLISDIKQSNCLRLCGDGEPPYKSLFSPNWLSPNASPGDVRHKCTCDAPPESAVVLMDSLDRSSLSSNQNSIHRRTPIPTNHADTTRRVNKDCATPSECDGLLVETTLDTSNTIVVRTKSLDAGSSKHTVAYRLGVRKRLFVKRQVVADLALAFALVGILLMVVENETTVQHIKQMTASQTEKDNMHSGGSSRPDKAKEVRDPTSTNTTASSGSSKRRKSKLLDANNTTPTPTVASTNDDAGSEKAVLRRMTRSADDHEDAASFVSDVDECLKQEQPIGYAVRESVLPYKLSNKSYLIKVAISVSTLFVEIFIIVYQIYEIQVYCVDHCVLDWRLAMSPGRIFQIALELVICGIHPLPHFDRSHLLCIRFMQPANTAFVISYVPLDIFFSLPMVFRAYLVVRVVVLHSRLMTDASSRSIGAMNRITFNTTFVFKTFMTNQPGVTLTVFIMMLWIINSWIIHVCESFHNEQFHIYNNAIWHTAVTFFSIGYGDVVPITYWGRTISISTGLMGAGCTAFLVAVVARKLELTRAEKHVHNFMTDSQLTKKLKGAAANVIRETWLIFKNKQLSKHGVSVRVCIHQRKLLDAIQHLREIKIKQRKLTDSANALIDVVKLHNDLGDTIDEARESQNRVSQRIDILEEKLKTLQCTIDALPDVLMEKFNAMMSRSQAQGLPINRSVSNYEFQHASKPGATHGEQTADCRADKHTSARQLSNSGVSLSSSNIWYLQNPRS